MLHDYLWNTLQTMKKVLIFDYVITGKNKHPATLLSVYFLDMLVMDPFQVYFTQNRYFCFYFLTLTFVFVPSLAYDKSRCGEAHEITEDKNITQGLILSIYCF